MGLDFSHCDAHWSYSGFNRFRTRIAKDIGVDLDKMYGFGGSTSWDTVKDAMVPFLYHSDCDGKLTVSQLKKIAPRLKEIVSKWPDNDDDKDRALELVKGMDKAIKENKPLLFQ
jgi:hypothetical protein